MKEIYIVYSSNSYLNDTDNVTLLVRVGGFDIIESFQVSVFINKKISLLRNYSIQQVYGWNISTYNPMNLSC